MIYLKFTNNRDSFSFGVGFLGELLFYVEESNKPKKPAFIKITSINYIEAVPGSHKAAVIMSGADIETNKEHVFKFFQNEKDKTFETDSHVFTTFIDACDYIESIFPNFGKDKGGA